MVSSTPLVSVVTPVYNGEKYLIECIDSVLSQTYQNWSYTIVDNCSSDKTLEIANTYQQRDSRIKVISNDHFVGPIENHNIAFNQISAQSKYCKVVSADDWLYPDCIEKLVKMAEQHPSIGIVQAYILNANGVRWPGLTPNQAMFSGLQIGRLYLLGEMEFSGIPTANLFRSSLVRSADAFFPGSRPTADASACLRCLQCADFGIVPQILSFERIHGGQITAESRKLASYVLDRIELLLEYGPVYLSQSELQGRFEELTAKHYTILAGALVRFEERAFWRYHRMRLTELGLPFYSFRLARATLMQLLDVLLNPKQSIERGLTLRARSKRRKISTSRYSAPSAGNKQEANRERERPHSSVAALK